MPVRTVWPVMTRRAVPFILAVAGLAVSAGMVAYLLMRDAGAKPTATVGALPSASPVPSSDPAVGPARFSVTKLMADAGCTGAVIGTQMFSYETGRCDLDGGEVTIAAFDSNDLRNQWTESASAYGGTFVQGDRWAAMVGSPAVARTLAERLEGRRV
jgi:hypothetical protein